MILIAVGCFILALILIESAREGRRHRKRDESLRHITGAAPWWERR